MSRKPAKLSSEFRRKLDDLEDHWSGLRACPKCGGKHSLDPLAIQAEGVIDCGHRTRPQETLDSATLRTRLGAGGRTGSSLASLAEQIAAAGLPAPQREHRFHPTRRWRFDLAWPEHRVAVEYEGGVATKARGRHSRGWGFEADCEKYAEAALAGWLVLRCTFDHVRDRRALGWLRRALDLRRSPAGPA